jgi:hypothetical protein
MSLAKGPVTIIGMVLLAYGVTGLIFGGHDFVTAAPDGTVNGKTWLGIEGNGWSNILAIGAGGLLLFAAQLHWGAKIMAFVVGLGFAAAAIIAVIDGNDVFGVFAANGATMLAWGIAAAVLLIVALLPRAGGGAPERDVVATEADRDARFARADDRATTDVGAVSERRT